MVTRINCKEPLKGWKHYAILVNDAISCFAMTGGWRRDWEYKFNPIALRKICKNVLSAVTMPIPRYVSNSKTYQKVHMKRQMFSQIYSQTRIGVPTLYQLTNIQYAKALRSVPMEITIH